jgi:hypothetical protein
MPPEWIPPTKLDWQHLIRRSENYDRDPKLVDHEIPIRDP